MPDELILTPNTTGDLIGRAIRVYRANIATWAPLLVWPTICILIGRVDYQYFFVTMQKGASSFAGWGVLIGAIIVLFGKWLLVQKLLSFVRLSTGFSRSLSDAETYLKKKRWTMLGLLALGLIMLIAVIVLWALEIVAAGVLIKILPIPGILATFFGVIGMTISTIFIWLALGLSLAALACEKGGAGDLLARGFTMASRYFFRTMFCGFIVAFTVNLIAVPLWTPVMIGGMVEYLRTGPISPTQGLPVHWQIFVAAWETVIEMVTQPILCLAYGFYYYDLRLRNEGVDVLESLEALKLKQNALLDIP